MSARQLPSLRALDPLMRQLVFYRSEGEYVDAARTMRAIDIPYACMIRVKPGATPESFRAVREAFESARFYVLFLPSSYLTGWRTKITSNECQVWLAWDASEEETAQAFGRLSNLTLLRKEYAL